MPFNHLIKLIKKYLNLTITEKELKVLEKLLEKEGNEKIFKEFVSKDYKLKTKNINANYKVALDKAILKQESKKVLNKKKSSVIFYRYAATVVLLFGLAFVIKQINPTNTEIKIEEKVTENEIELLLHDGSKQILSQKVKDSIQTSFNAIIGYLNKGKLQYLKQSTDKILTFNTIKVPYGKQFSLILSDGTKVEMNSGSSLRYPVTFLKKGTRNVFLEGEAYFDVAKNSNNPFIVKTNDLKVKVLGTRFNISAYQEDEAIFTTLEEGLVEVYNNSNENKIQLAPNEQSFWNKNDRNLQKRVVDISPFLSWREGRIIFKNTRFNTIVKKLQRKYDVIIINNNSQIENEKFTAVFDNEKIEQILHYFSESYEFKYRRNGKTITIE